MMAKIKYLSYPLASTVPGYGNPRKPIEIAQVRSMGRGDVCEIFSVKLENHSGTHIDCPAHFCKWGKKITEFSPETWRFSRPQVIPVLLREGELLTEKNIRSAIDPRADLLLLKSGWSKCRGTVRYSRKNPGIHESFGALLRRRFPRIRAVGFDWISLSSFLKREDGWAAHRAFLDPRRKGKPVLILEDMDLRPANAKLKEVWVSPLQVRGIDSSPCTVFGVFAQ